MQVVYIWLNIVAFLMIAVLGVLSYKDKEEPASTYFMYSMFFMAIWTLGTICELSTSNFYWKVFFRDVVQLGMAFVSVSNYWFVVSYTKAVSKLHHAILRIFIVLNVIAMLLLFTDPIHHLLRSRVYLVESGGITDLMVTSTPLGFFFVLIRFVLFGFATVLLLIQLAKTFKQMRNQVITIFAGFFVALVLLLSKQYLLEQHGFSMPMAAILCIPYLFIGISVFNFDFLSVSPLAKDWVINSLEEGVIVLSKEGDVVESNTSANLLLNNFDAKSKAALQDIYHSAGDGIHQIKVGTAADALYYEVAMHFLFTTSGKQRGAVAVIRNVTEQTMQQFALKEKAELDSLTRVLNRETLEKKYEMLERAPMGMLIIDIDQFKKINDTYGHPTGDRVIIRVVQIIKSCTRSGDLVGRLGGDEFCVILVGCTAEQCMQIANRITQEVTSQRDILTSALSGIGICVSIGVCTGLNTGDSFYDAYQWADAMLYKAKKRGGNCAVAE
jgi:diguanylate cyclase (GGDEF)-like protein